MPRTNQDGKDIRLVLEWLCHRHFSDAELAAALDIPPATYSRRKDADDFPSFEELETFAKYFELSARALQVAFGYLDLNRVLLDESELRQYVEQGGGVTPLFPTRPKATTTTTTRVESPTVLRRRRRPDAPAGA